MKSWTRAMLKGCGLALVLVGLSGVALAVPGDAPEIDPGSLTSALTLLSGGVLFLTGRRRKS